MTQPSLPLSPLIILILSKHEAHTHLFTPIPEHRQGKGLATHWPPYLGNLTIRLHGPGWWGGKQADFSSF